MTTLFQPIPTSSSAPANGSYSVFISTTDDYVVYRLLHVSKKNFREHFMLQLNYAFRGQFGLTRVVVDCTVTDPGVVRGLDPYDSTQESCQ